MPVRTSCSPAENAPRTVGSLLTKDKNQVLKHGYLSLEEETKQLSGDSTLLMHVCGKTGCPRTRGYKAIFLGVAMT